MNVGISRDVVKILESSGSHVFNFESPKLRASYSNDITPLPHCHTIQRWQVTFFVPQIQETWQIEEKFHLIIKDTWITEWLMMSFPWHSPYSRNRVSAIILAKTKALITFTWWDRGRLKVQRTKRKLLSRYRLMTLILYPVPKYCRNRFFAIIDNRKLLMTFTW